MSKNRKLKGVSGLVIGIIVVILIIIAAVGVYVVMTSHHPTPTVSTTSSVISTTTTATLITTTTPPNTSNAQALMQLVGLTSAPSTPVTITVWDSYSTTEDQAFNITLTQFEQEFPWIHVEVTHGAPVGVSQFETAAKAGQAPIVYRDADDWAGQLFAAGLLLNLSQYLPPSVFSLYVPLAIHEWELNSTVYGLPDDVNYIAMLYNKHFVPYPPNTTNQLIQIAEQVNKTYHIWGIAYGVGHDFGYRFGDWVAGFGGHLYTTQNGQVIPDLNSTAMINALNFWYNLTYVYHVNYWAPSVGAGGVEGELFMANKTAIIFDGTWDLGVYLQALGPNLGVAPLPVVSQTGLRASQFVGATGWVIATPQVSGASPMQIKAALIFILYITNAEATLRLGDIAHDIPANMQGYEEFLTQLKEDQLQPAYMNQIMEEIVAEMQYGQMLPNYPAQPYYYTIFPQYASEFFAGKISASQAAQEMEQTFIQTLEQNGLLSIMLPPPIPIYLISYMLLLAPVLLPPLIKIRKR